MEPIKYTGQFSVWANWVLVTEITLTAGLKKKFYYIPDRQVKTSQNWDTYVQAWKLEDENGTNYNAYEKSSDAYKDANGNPTTYISGTLEKDRYYFTISKSYTLSQKEVYKLNVKDIHPEWDGPVSAEEDDAWVPAADISTKAVAPTPVATTPATQTNAAPTQTTVADVAKAVNPNDDLPFN